LIRPEAGALRLRRGCDLEFGFFRV
jgi:hypothetical protein